MAVCTSVLRGQSEDRSLCCLTDTLDRTECADTTEVVDLEAHADLLTLQKSALTGMVSVKSCLSLYSIVEYHAALDAWKHGNLKVMFDCEGFVSLTL